MSSADHIFLYFFLYLCLVCCDIVTRAERTDYRRLYTKIFTILSVIAYVTVEGFRYGRGVDYFGYGPMYIHCFTRTTEQPAFDFLMRAIKSIDISVSLPYGICFHAYALIFITCLFKLYRRFCYESKYFLLFACFATLYMTEWTIRQGVSMSFVLTGIYFLLKKNYYIAGLFGLFAIFTHFGNTVSIVIIVMFFFFLNKKPLPVFVTIPVFIIMQNAFEILMPFMKTYIQSLDLSILGGSFQGYINNYDRLLGTEAISAVADEWARSSFTQLATTLYYSGLILVGYYLHKIKPDKVFIYNCFVVGIMIIEPFRLIGNLTRVFVLLSILWFIPFSMATYYYKMLKKFRCFQLAYWVVIAYLVMYYGRYVFLNPSATYVWNIIK